MGLQQAAGRIPCVQGCAQLLTAVTEPHALWGAPSCWPHAFGVPCTPGVDWGCPGESSTAGLFRHGGFHSVHRGTPRSVQSPSSLPLSQWWWGFMQAMAAALFSLLYLLQVYTDRWQSVCTMNWPYTNPKTCIRVWRANPFICCKNQGVTRSRKRSRAFQRSKIIELTNFSSAFIQRWHISSTLHFPLKPFRCPLVVEDGLLPTGCLTRQSMFFPLLFCFVFKCSGLNLVSIPSCWTPAALSEPCKSLPCKPIMKSGITAPQHTDPSLQDVCCLVRCHLLHTGTQTLPCFPTAPSSYAATAWGIAICGFVGQFALKLTNKDQEKHKMLAKIN